ncbi:DMT family transporter [Neisseria lisongii]|uniref:DMT family transporter n=1 Tax=Neisseria lisongii TaxID=2912188 RepID=A0AAW5AF02_9NEIS|nr:DMT family transporter [Neisseria lisongii]MCF7530281.1 DMT family transporter [Neisseria lisongii]
MFVGYLFALVSGLLWGIATFLYSSLNNSFFLSHPFFILIIIFSIDFLAFLFSGAYIAFNANKIPFNKRNFIGIILSCFSGILSSISMIFYLLAIQRMDAVYVAPISSMYPIVGAILSYFLLEEKLNHYAKFGFLFTVLCVIGLGFSPSSADFSWLGFLFSLFTVIGWGSEITISGYAMKYLDFYSVYFFRQLSSSLLYFITILFVLELNYDDVNNFMSNNGVFVLGIIFSSIISYFLYYRSVYYINPIKAMLLNTTYGIWVVLLSWLYANSEFSIVNILLSIGIIIGCTLVLKETK